MDVNTEDETVRVARRKTLICWKHPNLTACEDAKPEGNGCRGGGDAGTERKLKRLTEELTVWFPHLPKHVILMQQNFIEAKLLPRIFIYAGLFHVALSGVVFQQFLR